ncbi:uncharacterized protein [Nicotiana sylvestris]|uniref:uncharacterized protein n=1 Tax=Nicotiana sylvestris TaxID=4096 RepID=UPI00388C70B3
MPKFDLYDGNGDPVAHLRGFCRKMRGDGGKDELLMAYFSQSLSGSALEWYTRQDHGRWYTWDDLAQAFACHFQYNLEIILNHLSLTKLEKKHNESFREYGFRWREQAARVDPPMKESEMVDYFLQSLEPTYYGHLVLTIGKSFNEVVKMGEKCWQLKTAIQELIDTNWIEVQAPEAPNINQNLLLAHHEINMIEIVHRGGKPKKPSQAVMMIRASKVRPSAKSTSEKSVIRLSRANNEPSAVVKKGSSSGVAVKQEKAKVVVLGVANKPVIIVEGARTNPVIIKPVTQLPIVNNKAVSWNYERVTVNYKGKKVKEELNVDDERIHKNSICFRGFDSGGKDSVGDIMLKLTIGPVEFTMEFQVLDVAISYNLLLGRPWIHAAKAVSSTLH